MFFYRGESKGGNDNQFINWYHHTPGSSFFIRCVPEQSDQMRLGCATLKPAVD